MTDRHSKETRSYNMSRIRSKNTKPEILVRKHLFSSGYRYRLHDRKLPGTPDIVLSKYRTVIFVNGCFWHGHDECQYFKIPASNVGYWIKKIDRNKQNDNNAVAELIAKHWNVIVLWECELKPKKIAQTFIDLRKRIHNQVNLNQNFI